MTKEEVMRQISTEWQNLQSVLQSLSEQQLSGPVDAAGWRAQDHIMHIAGWERCLVGVLNGQPAHVALGVDEAVWKSYNFDTINNITFLHNHSMPLADVMATAQTTHAQMLNRLETLQDSDLSQPITNAQIQADHEDSTLNWILGSTVFHYKEHLPWIASLAANNSNSPQE